MSAVSVITPSRSKRTASYRSRVMTPAQVGGFIDHPPWPRNIRDSMVDRVEPAWLDQDRSGRTIREQLLGEVGDRERQHFDLRQSDVIGLRGSGPFGCRCPSPPP